ncbi:ferric reductase, partial [Streptomyces sp. NPDC001774]
MTTEVQEPTHPALAAYLEQREGRVRPAPTSRRVPPAPTYAPRTSAPRTPAPRPPAPLRVSPDRLRDGLVGGAGGVALVWGVQAQPSARLDAFFAGGAHLTGLLAGYGVLVMLFLMARVPAVEHGVGADRLARWHAFGGRYVLGLVGAHALLALCGYAVHTRTDLVTAAGGLLSYPALAAATAG